MGNRQSNDFRQQHLRAQDETAEQARGNIVGMQAATRELLTLEGKRQQCLYGQWRVEQRVDGDHGGDGGCRRRAHAGLQRHALQDLELDTHAVAVRIEESLCRDRRRIALGIRGQVGVAFTVESANFGNRRGARIIAARLHAIAGAFERQSQHVEADGDVADRRGCKCRYGFRHTPRRC